jgi:hypothetical protein
MNLLSNKNVPALRVTVLAALMAGSGASHAFQPLITDDTGTQGSDGNQVELSWNRDRVSAAGETVTTTILPFVLTRGVTDELDLFVQANHTSFHASAGGAASGAGNPSFGAKWRFYEDEDSKLSLGIKPEFRLPVSAGKEASGLGTGRWSHATTFILTQELPFGALHANLAVGNDRYRSDSGLPDARTLRLSAAPVWDLDEHWKIGLDVGTAIARSDGRRIRNNFVELGTIYSPSDDLDFAFGLIRQKNDDNPRASTASLTVGVTWRFK